MEFFSMMLEQLGNHLVKENKLSKVLNLGTIDIFSQIILCCRSCPVHFAMFSSILGFYSLDTRNTLPPSFDNPKCLHTLPNVPWGTESSPIENHLIRSISYIIHQIKLQMDQGPKHKKMK